MTESNRLHAQQRGRNGAIFHLPMTTANPAKRILVVGSDEPIAEIVAAMLRTESYKCDCVCGHSAILRVLKRIENYDLNYDLLFCQVSVLEKEKKLLTWVLGRGRDTPVVACAARSREQVPKAIYDRCTFQQVPFEKQQFVELVRGALEHHDQVAMCYDVRVYAVNMLGYFELLQENSKAMSTLHRKAITGGMRNAKAAVDTVETLFQSLRKAHS